MWKWLALVVVVPAVAVADPQLPNGADAVDALPMAGPYRDAAAICPDCKKPPPACAHASIAKLGGAFDAAKVVDGCTVALHASAGWYALSTEGLPAWAGFLNNGDRYQSELTSISQVGALVVVRGTFIHDTNAAKMLWLAKPPEDNWYECEERIFVCGAGAHGPSCAGPFSVAYTAYCRRGDDVTKPMHRAEPHDFRFDARVSGTDLALHGTAPLAVPLPGWAVTAMDAPHTVGDTRPLSPPHVALRFP